MDNSNLKETVERKYSSAKKRNIVEELRSGMLTIRQCTKQYRDSISILQDWNRWYYKTRLLKYFKPKPSLLMEPSIERLKQHIAAMHN